jgi:hypothetical protein
MSESNESSGLSEPSATILVFDGAGSGIVEQCSAILALLVFTIISIFCALAGAGHFPIQGGSAS